MKAIARHLTHFSAWLAQAALVLSCAALLLMLSCICVQVVSRYLMSEPLAWTEELARYAMVWSGFLGATVAFHRGADPVLLRRTSLPYWLRGIARWLALIAPTVLGVCVLIATPAVLALASTRTTETLSAPAALIFSILPISFALLLVHVLAKAARLLAGEDDDL